VWRDKGYSGPLAVIPQFGVDPELFYPDDRPPRREFVIGFIGRLVFEKGVDMLVKAAAALPGTWRLVFCGGGPERETLERLAQELNIGERVAFDDWQDSTQMPQYYRRLDVLALPSRTRPNWMEQFGRVLVEAMACGVPVVGSTCGEIPNVIGDAGLIFQEDNVAQLRRQLLRLQQQPDLRRKLGERGRQRVLDRYTQKQIAAQTVAVYREIMGTTSQ